MIIQENFFNTILSKIDLTKIITQAIFILKKYLNSALTKCLAAINYMYCFIS